MLQTVKKYNTIFWQFRKMHLMVTLERRTDFIFWGVVSGMWTIFNIFFFTLILGVTDSIAGWNKEEMYLLLGVFSIVDACTWSIFYFNMMRYTNSVYDGELNSILLKPINPIFMIMTRYNNYNNIFRLLMGIGLTVWAYNQLSLTFSLVTWLLFMLGLLLALLTIYFLWFILSTSAFYFEKLDNINEIVPNIRRTWQLPRSIYPPILSFVLTFILPFGLVVSLPTEILLGKPVFHLLAYLGLFTIGSMIVGNYFFHYSLQRFSGNAQ